MKELFIKDLIREGQATLFAVVASKDQKEKKDGKPYLNVELVDKTGKLDAKVWDDVETVGAALVVGEVVKLQGPMGEYRGKAQFTIKKARLATPDEIERADYLQCSDRSIDEMVSELDSHVDGIQTPFVKLVVRNILDDPIIANKLRGAAAAMKVHHAFAGGLLEHVCSLLGLATRICEHYPSLDRDMLHAICILHDICKCVELDVTMKISYSTEGQLLGHVAMGYALLNKHCDMIENFPKEIRWRLGHMILSHHGSLEHGALKIPAFPEAMVFHSMDALDANMEMMKRALLETSPSEEFTPWVPYLTTQVYRGQL